MSAEQIRPGGLAIGGLIAMAAAIGIGRFIYTPILPSMAEALHLTKGEAGLIASANFLGYLAGAVAAASPRLYGGPRAWLVGMLAISALTTAAMAWPEGMPSFLALRFAGGAASAYVLVLASALVLERLAAAGYSQLSALHFSGVGIGIIVSALLTWALAAAGAGWRAMWLAGGLLVLASVAAVATLVPDARPVPQAASTPPASHGGDKRLPLLAIAYGLFGFGYIITATFIVDIVRRSPEAAPVEPLFWLVLGLAAAPSVAIWVPLGRRIGVVRAYALACLMEAAGVFASVASTSVAGLLLASALLGGTFMGLTALGLIAARNILPAVPRRAIALLTAAFGLGQIAGPIVAGYGFDLTGSFYAPSLLAAGGLLVGACLALLIDRKNLPARTRASK